MRSGAWRRKRGGGAAHLPMTDDFDLAATDDASLVALDDALKTLSKQSLRLAQVVECRFFAGYDEAETALALSISERTVRRDWTLARAWLQREMYQGWQRLERRYALARSRRARRTRGCASPSSAVSAATPFSSSSRQAGLMALVQRFAEADAGDREFPVRVRQ